MYAYVNRIRNIKEIRTISKRTFIVKQNALGDLITSYLICQHVLQQFPKKHQLVNHYQLAFNLKRFSGVGEDFEERNVVLNGKAIRPTGG